MELKQLISDDDAVSPVIGVILMVAITVILAAVIASFVLGLGNQASNTTPQASFGFSYEETSSSNSEGILKISHDSGDAITKSNLYVRGSGFLSSVAGTTKESSSWFQGSAGEWKGKATGSSGSNSQVVSGNFVYVGVDSDFEIDVVYETADGSTSTTLSSEKGPDA